MCDYHFFILLMIIGFIAEMLIEPIKMFMKDTIKMIYFHSAEEIATKNRTCFIATQTTASWFLLKSDHSEVKQATRPTYNKRLTWRVLHFSD